MENCHRGLTSFNETGRRVFRGLASAFLFWSTCIASAYAGPANPAPIILLQPDGTTFVARVVGDEWANGHQTIEGYAILHDSRDGFWKYADAGPDGSLVLTPLIVARDAPDGLQRGLRPQLPPGTERPNAGPLLATDAVLGNKPTLVILAQFSNKAGSTTAASWQSRFFGA